MGDKSPKAKEKAKKQSSNDKVQKQAAAAKKASSLSTAVAKPGK